jgi:N-acetyl-1-D-myo-inositol-2-amino-2-deoxy-alpha-D-glucopyranoside deacetylase
MSADLVSEDETRSARLLFVHAHPDDETLTTGLTMAAYASRHDEVHLLTCTLGEQGEVIPPALAYLCAERDDLLGPWRREELRAAMSVLGVAHSVLGEDLGRGVGSRYRDSGMAGSASAEHPDAFVRADLDEAAALVAEHIRAMRPDVVVTYDPQGGYAHPDHIQTHAVTMSALTVLSAEADQAPVPVAFCVLTAQSWASQDRQWLHDHVAPNGANRIVLQHDEPYAPSVVCVQNVTHVIEEPSLVELQSRALSRYATQVVVYEGCYALSNHIAVRLSGREGFARFDPVVGQLVPAAPGAARHRGLLTHSQGHR